MLRPGTSWSNLTLLKAPLAPPSPIVPGRRLPEVMQATKIFSLIFSGPRQWLLPGRPSTVLSMTNWADLTCTSGKLAQGIRSRSAINLSSTGRWGGSWPVMRLKEGERILFQTLNYQSNSKYLWQKPYLGRDQNVRRQLCAHGLGVLQRPDFYLLAQNTALFSLLGSIFMAEMAPRRLLCPIYRDVLRFIGAREVEATIVFSDKLSGSIYYGHS